MRAEGQCVMDGANDNEVDDNEDDDHDDDDDENYEDDNNDGADGDDVVNFVLVTTLRPTYPGGTPAPQPRVIHTPQPRIERDGPTTDYPLSGIGITNAGI